MFFSCQKAPFDLGAIVDVIEGESGANDFQGEWVITAALPADSLSVETATRLTQKKERQDRQKNSDEKEKKKKNGVPFRQRRSKQSV